MRGFPYVPSLAGIRSIFTRRRGGLIKPSVLIGTYTDDELADIIQAVPIHRLSDSRSIAAAKAISLAVQTALAESTVDLVAASFVPAPSLEIADVTIATFTGYAQVVNATVPAPFLDLVNGGWSIAVPATFTCTGSAIMNVIYGYVLQTAVPTIWQSGLLPIPLNVTTAGQGIPITILVNEQP